MANYRHRYTEKKLINNTTFTDSLPYSQVIRIQRISSNQVDLNNSLKEMKNNFVKQGTTHR